MSRLIFSALVIVFVSLGFFSTVQAMTVSPTRIEITADPGDTVQGEFKLINEEDQNRILYASYENFEARGETGTPYFIGAEDGLATWIETIDDINIRSGEIIDIPYTISIPENATPGGYFASIFFGNQPPDDLEGSGVAIGGKIGVLVLLRVSGDIEEGGGLIDFNTKGQQRFFTTLPIAFEYRFGNTGADRVMPQGDIEIKNTFRSVLTDLSANTSRGNVLPGSVRRFDVLWDDGLEELDSASFWQMVSRQWSNFYLGWYTANLDLVWSGDNQDSANFNFFIIPWQLLSVLIVTALVLIILIKLGLKRYKERIITETLNNDK